MSYFYNKRLKKLEKVLQTYKEEKNESYHTAKLVKTKRGVPVYLVHCILSEDGQIYGGFIFVLTTKGFDGCLNYEALRGNGQSIHIGDINHKMLNQGIGSHLLKYLDEIAIENGIKKITGWLSPLDLKSNREKLLHFYGKNGYQIAEEKDPVWNIRCLIATKHL